VPTEVGEQRERRRRQHLVRQPAVRRFLGQQRAVAANADHRAVHQPRIGRHESVPFVGEPSPEHFEVAERDEVVRAQKRAHAEPALDDGRVAGIGPPHGVG